MKVASYHCLLSKQLFQVRSAFYFLFLFIVGCSIPISYYDGTTYKQLTSLKVETVLLFESFDLKQVKDNNDNINKVTLDLLKAYEYERGKGDDNGGTAKQLKLIVDSFKDTVKVYRQYGPNSKKLGEKNFVAESITIGQAFDIAIETENLKNKDKR